MPRHPSPSKPRPAAPPARPSLEAASAVVWERPQPARRPAPAPLSREAIVTAAIGLADREGLEAVSLRRIGAALGAGPMRLYGYVATKEELLELMIDAIYGELAARGLPARSGWRQVLEATAHGLRRAGRQHRWFVDLLGGRPHLGPGALAYLEAVLDGVGRAPELPDVDAVMAAVQTVNAYVLGALRNEASDRLAESLTGKTKSEWQTAHAPYLRRLLATGRFPALERVMREATHPPFDAVFARGLDCVLDGVAARLTVRRRGRRA